MLMAMFWREHAQPGTAGRLTKLESAACVSCCSALLRMLASAAALVEAAKWWETRCRRHTRRVGPLQHLVDIHDCRRVRQRVKEGYLAAQEMKEPRWRETQEVLRQGRGELEEVAVGGRVGRDFEAKVGRA